MKLTFGKLSRSMRPHQDSPIVSIPKEAASTGQSVYALIIGINEYKSQDLEKLQGPTADAQAFEDYLKNDLNVPSSQITLLLNEHASRSNIIKAFSDIKQDDRIKRGDPIFIFYAGHGSEAAAPPGWEAGGKDAKIQMLVPQDFSLESGKEVHGIPDYTVGVLLNKIAKEKGDNITVVFDCCHSASASRGSTLPSTVLCRSADLPGYVMPANVDQDLFAVSGTRSGRVPQNLRHLGLQSYVMLSACQSFESARESNGHGYFSASLLNLLRAVKPENLKYSEIISKLEFIPNQNPQCEGLNKERYFFNRKVLAPPRKVYNLRRIHGQGPQKLSIDGGMAHGLSLGAELSVYQDKRLKGQLMGTIRIEALLPFSAIVSFISDGVDLSTDVTSYFAVQEGLGENAALRLYVQPKGDKNITNMLFPGGTADPLRKHVRVVDTKPEDAHITVTKAKNMFNLTHSDPQIAKYGKSTQIAQVDPKADEFSTVLRGLSHYFWNRDRDDTPREKGPQLMNNVQLEFFKLKQSPDNELQFEPDGLSLLQNDKVELQVHEDDVYGIRLTNNTDRDIFPNLFYFDHSDFSIVPYFTSPPVGGKAVQEAPLKKGGSLTLGYGSGGCAPWSYYLPEGERMDLGFLKLFVFTEPIDLSDIPQGALFSQEPTRGVRKTQPSLDRLWGTLLVPVIQRRPA